MICSLKNITTVYLQPVVHRVNAQGEALAGTVPGTPQFDHYECTTHNCEFRQWRAVLSHIGRPTATKAEERNAQATEHDIDLDTELTAIVHRASRAYTGADISPLVGQIKQAFADAGWMKAFEGWVTVHSVDTNTGEERLTRRRAHETVDAYLDAGGPRDLIITSQSDWERNAKLAGLMTGQEWYDRYRTEWNKICASGEVGANSHIEAAKKAAGIK